MAAFSALSDGERALFAALNARGVRFLVVGLSAAVLQGANTGTRDIDIWFEDTSDPRHVRDGDRVDVVTHMDGVEGFAREYARAIDMTIDGLPLRVMPIDRVIASKRASHRPKDAAVLPALEEAQAAIEDLRKKNP